MIKFREFMTKENLTLEEQLDSFVEYNDVEILDIKYQVILDTYHNIIMSFALVMYKEKGE